ncbi:unnamed protein product, partial [Nesidiocoris tenuis]
GNPWESSIGAERVDGDDDVMGRILLFSQYGGGIAKLQYLPVDFRKRFFRQAEFFLHRVLELRPQLERRKIILHNRVDDYFFTSSAYIAVNDADSCRQRSSSLARNLISSSNACSGGWLWKLVTRTLSAELKSTGACPRPGQLVLWHRRVNIKIWKLEFLELCNSRT